MNLPELVERISHSLNEEFSELSSSSLTVRELHREEGKVVKPRAKVLIPFVREKYKANVILYSECRLSDERQTRIALKFPVVAFSDTLPALPTVCRIGSVVQYPIPFTIVAKEVSPGFMKLRKAFVPLTDVEDFDGDKLFRTKVGGNPLLEKLNQDKELERLLQGIPKKTASVTGLVSEFKDGDPFNPAKCLGQLIPYKGKTCVAFQFAPRLETDALEQLEDVRFPFIKNMVTIIQRVAGYIENFGHKGETIAIVAAVWPIFSLLREWCRD